MVVAHCSGQWRVFAVAVSLALGIASTEGMAADGNNEISVRVDIQGDVVRVDADLMIPATAKEVWAVLTDFEHLSEFISNIASSRVLAREGNVVRIAQTGKTSFGKLSFEFQSVRELTLSPFDKIDSRMLSGNMKRFHGTTHLEAGEGKTILRFHSEAVPDTFLPMGLGRSLIESETREHYQEIRKEVLRRQRVASEK